MNLQRLKLKGEIRELIHPETQETNYVPMAYARGYLLEICDHCHTEEGDAYLCMYALLMRTVRSFNTPAVTAMSDQELDELCDLAEDLLKPISLRDLEDETTHD